MRDPPGAYARPQVDRKQVPADWNRKLQAIQAKAAAAVRELPPGFLGQFEGAGGPWPLCLQAHSWDSQHEDSSIYSARKAAAAAAASLITSNRSLPCPPPHLLAPPEHHLITTLPPCRPAGGEDAPLDYFQAQRVLAKLSETAEKSLLGSLKGAAGEWDKVVRAYEYNRERGCCCLFGSVWLG